MSHKTLHTVFGDPSLRIWTNGMFSNYKHTSKTDVLLVSFVLRGWLLSYHSCSPLPPLLLNGSFFKITLDCDFAFSMKNKEEPTGNSWTNFIMENFLLLYETMVIF